MSVPDKIPTSLAESVMKNTPEDLLNPIRPDTVLRPGVPANRELFGRFIDTLMVEGSGILGSQHIREFYDRCQKGESCLFLVEHVGNLDYPCLFRLMERDELLGKEVAESVLPLQGIKLVNESPIISSFSSAYETIVIVPSRTIDSIPEGDDKEKKHQEAREINRSSIQILVKKKHAGRLILLYPTGTRSRPWDPSTYLAVKEVQSYLKTFDKILFVTIHGNCLPTKQGGDLLSDTPKQDLILFTCSPVMDAREYYNNAKEEFAGDEDVRDSISQSVMSVLKKQHDEHQAHYEELCKTAVFPLKDRRVPPLGKL